MFNFLDLLVTPVQPAKRLACWLALGALFTLSAANAASLGDIRVQSGLNSNLVAEIKLSGVPDSELKQVRVSLAPDRVWDSANVKRLSSTTKLKFAVDAAGAGATINILGVQPVREPVVDLIIQASTPQGILQRWYTIFLDPPAEVAQTATVERAAVVAQPVVVAPPIQAAATQPARVLVPAQAAKFPTQAGQVVPVQEIVRPAPSAGSQFSSSGARAPQPNAAQANAKQNATIIQPTVSPIIQADSYGPVARGETLYSIAKKVRPAGVSVEQAIAAILRTNPLLFNGDPRNLPVGARLYLPPKRVMTVLTTAEAKAFVGGPSAAAGSRADRSSARRVNQRAPAPSVPAAPAVNASQPQSDLPIAKTYPLNESAPAETTASSSAEKSMAPAAIEQPEPAKKAEMAGDDANQPNAESTTAAADNSAAADRSSAANDEQAAESKAATADTAGAMSSDGDSAEAVATVMAEGADNNQNEMAMPMADSATESGDEAAADAPGDEMTGKTATAAPESAEDAAELNAENNAETEPEVDREPEVQLEAGSQAQSEAEPGREPSPEPGPEPEQSPPAADEPEKTLADKTGEAAASALGTVANFGKEAASFVSSAAQDTAGEAAEESISLSPLNFGNYSNPAFWGEYFNRLKSGQIQAYNPIIWVALLLLLLLLLLFRFARRRRSAAEPVDYGDLDQNPASAVAASTTAKDADADSGNKAAAGAGAAAAAAAVVSKDPLGDANFHLDYGMHGQALEILRAAQPGAKPKLQQLLLQKEADVLLAQGDDDALAELQTQQAENQKLQSYIAERREELGLDEQAVEPEADAATEAEPEEDTSLDMDEFTAPPPSAEPAQVNEEPLDFDFDDPLEVSATSSEPEPKPSADSDVADLEFDEPMLSLPDDEPEIGEPKAAVPEQDSDALNSLAGDDPAEAALADLDIDDAMVELEKLAVPAADDSDGALDLDDEADLDALSLDESDSDSDASDQPASADDENDLDFDLDSLGAELDAMEQAGTSGDKKSDAIGELESITESLGDSTGDDSLDDALTLDDLMEGEDDAVAELDDSQHIPSNSSAAADPAAEISFGDVMDTQMDLARAYIDMGDSDEARKLLETITERGSGRQQAEAEKLLQELGE